MPDFNGIPVSPQEDEAFRDLERLNRQVAYEAMQERWHTMLAQHAERSRARRRPITSEDLILAAEAAERVFVHGTSGVGFPD